MEDGQFREAESCPHRRLAVERLVLDTADFLQAWKMVNSGKQNRRSRSRFHSTSERNCPHRRLAVERLVLDTAELSVADETRSCVVARVARSVTGKLGGRPDRRSNLIGAIHRSRINHLHKIVQEGQSSHVACRLKCGVCRPDHRCRAASVGAPRCLHLRRPLGRAGGSRAGRGLSALLLPAAWSRRIGCRSRRQRVQSDTLQVLAAARRDG